MSELLVLGVKNQKETRFFNEFQGQDSWSWLPLFLQGLNNAYGDGDVRGHRTWLTRLRDTRIQLGNTAV